MCNNEELNKETSVDWEKLTQELLIEYDEAWKKLAGSED